MINFQNIHLVRDRRGQREKGRGFKQRLSVKRRDFMNNKENVVEEKCRVAQRSVAEE